MQGWVQPNTTTDSKKHSNKRYRWSQPGAIGQRGLCGDRLWQEQIPAPLTPSTDRNPKRTSVNHRLKHDARVRTMSKLDRSSSLCFCNYRPTKGFHNHSTAQQLSRATGTLVSSSPAFWSTFSTCDILGWLFQFFSSSICPPWWPSRGGWLKTDKQTTGRRDVAWECDSNAAWHCSSTLCDGTPVGLSLCF